MLQSNTNYIILGQVRSNRRQAFTHLISFIGLKRMGSETRNIIKEQVHLLSMSGHPVLIRIDCNGVHGTVIGKRRTRNRLLVLVKMENGFTLKLNAETVSKLPVAPTTPMITTSAITTSA